LLGIDSSEKKGIEHKVKAQKFAKTQRTEKL
jgi:hypothetical protein